MYIVGQELTINWKIVGQEDPINLADFDVLVERPDGTKTSHLSALYLDTDDNGTVKDDNLLFFTFTPDVPGVWVVKLTSGTSSEYRVYKTMGLTLRYPDTTAYQQVSIRELDGTLASMLSGNSLQ